MRWLIIVLFIVGCSEEEIKKQQQVIEKKEECERLLNNTYDATIYPDNECRCIYVQEGIDYVFSHKWSPKQYQMYLDSVSCGYKVIQYNNINIIKNDVVIDGQTLKCDC